MWRVVAWALQHKLPHVYRSGCNHPKEVNSISARDLYLDLGMSAPNWSSWSQSNIVKNEFLKQGIDFIELMPNMSCPNPPKDYAVTINTAKHIAMMAKTQRAHD